MLNSTSTRTRFVFSNLENSIFPWVENILDQVSTSFGPFLFLLKYFYLFSLATLFLMYFELIDQFCQPIFFLNWLYFLVAQLGGGWTEFRPPPLTWLQHDHDCGPSFIKLCQLRKKYQNFSLALRASWFLIEFLTIFSFST